MALGTMSCFDHYGEFCAALGGSGAFLVVQAPEGQPTVMTVGWATLGLVWGEPVLTVFVRPSRFTAPVLQEARRFSLNVPLGRMQRELEYCGTHSGRDGAKLEQAGLATAEGLCPDLTILPGCDLIYECEIVQRLEFQPQGMPRELKGMFYGAGDYHRCHFGRVLRAQCQAPMGNS